MTDEPAAIRASFSDFRIIKGRKQAQLILEVPIEEADNALAVLGGIPQPQSDCWVAVARLNGKQKTESYGDQLRRVMANQAFLTEGAVWVEGEDSYQYQNGDWVPNNPNQKGQYPTHAKRPGPKEKQRWEDLKLSMQAGIRCNEPAFQRFMREGYDSEVHGDDDEDAANAVRHICGVNSRSGLNDNPEAAERWRQLERSYQAWLKGAE